MKGDAMTEKPDLDEIRARCEQFEKNIIWREGNPTDSYVRYLESQTSIAGLLARCDIPALLEYIDQLEADIRELEEQ